MAERIVFSEKPLLSDCKHRSCNWRRERDLGTAVSATHRRSDTSAATLTGHSSLPLARLFSKQSLFDRNCPVSPPIWNAIWNVLSEWAHQLTRRLREDWLAAHSYSALSTSSGLSLITPAAATQDAAPAVMNTTHAASTHVPMPIGSRGVIISALSPRRSIDAAMPPTAPIVTGASV